MKRDDALDALHGGTKVRKLDHLLAAPPWRDAPHLGSVGALGSGHLVACAAASEHLGRRFDARLFWQEPTDEVLQKLGYTASHCAAFAWTRSRTRFVLGAPRIAWASMAGRSLGGVRWIPPGGTTPAGLLGVVRAGVELADQVKAGDLPEPQRVYVALGSGGTAVGLAVGLGLAGVTWPVHAVVVVEHALSSGSRVRGLTRQLVRLLAAHGVDGVVPAPVVLDRSQVGKGYGHPTVAGRRALGALLPHDIHLETTYTGKALAALMSDADQLRGADVLFWNTNGRTPTEADWRSSLPDDLVAAIEEARAGRRRRKLTRRAMIGAAVSVALGAALYDRATGYEELPDWRGRTLDGRQAQLLAAVAAAILVPQPDPDEALEIAARVDRFVGGLPTPKRDEIALLLPTIEHATPLGGSLRRFTSLDVPDRLEVLRGLRDLGGLAAQASRGIRDLVLIGAYQIPGRWELTGYSGPMVAPEPRTVAPRYARLVAKPGQLPRAAEAAS